MREEKNISKIILDFQQTLLKAKDKLEIYRLVPDTIKQIIGSGIVLSTILNEEDQSLQIVKYTKLNTTLDKITHILGSDLTKNKVYIKDMTDQELKLYRSGELEKLEDGIYALLTRKYPKPVCQVLGKTLGIKEVYTIGFVYQKIHYGGIIILTNKEISQYIYEIEQIASQASMIVQRLIVDEKLKEAKKKTEESEEKYRQLFENLTYGFQHNEVITDKEGNAIDFRILESNAYFEAFSGIKPSEIKGKTIREVMPNVDPKMIKRYCDVGLTGIPFSMDYYSQTFSKHIKVSCYSPKHNQFACLFEDITTQKKIEEEVIRAKEKAELGEKLLQNKNEEILLNNERLESLFRISLFEPNSIQELFDYALHEAIELTRSKIGYIYFYDEKKKQFILNSWSKEVMKDCRIVDPQTTYDLEKTGLWGEAVRQKKPIIENNYAADSELKKGLPDGHVQLKNFLTIPVIIDNTIVAVAGVANKKEDYNNSDIRQLSLLMDKVWRISERTTIIKELSEAKDKAEKNERFLIESQKIGNVGSYITKFPSTEWKISEQMYSILGIDKEFPHNLDGFIKLVHPYSLNDFTEYFNKITEEAKPFDYTYKIIRFIDKEERWVRGLGEFIKDEKGNVTMQIGTIQDVTEQKDAEFELKKKNTELSVAKEKAEESDRLKTVFLQNISHEIRTPMNTILGFSEILRDKGIPDDKRDLYLEIVNNSGKLLQSIVDDILTVSLIEANQLKANYEETNIKYIINELFSVYEIKAKERNIKLKVYQEAIEEEAKIITDSNKLKQVLTNLLNNAFKFTKIGTIEFGYYMKETIIEFYVKDTGIGISKEDQEKIFERFQQISSNDKRFHEGMGLGLSISKSFIELLNGEIWVESEYGKGSTFTFTIPLNPTAHKSSSILSHELN